MRSLLVPSCFVPRLREGKLRGVTSNPEDRLGVHYEGTRGYTSGRLPVELVWCCEFPDMMSAIQAEKQIKDWSRSKKRALIEGDIDLLHQLASCQNMTHYTIQAAPGKYKPKGKPEIERKPDIK